MNPEEVADGNGVAGQRADEARSTRMDDIQVLLVDDDRDFVELTASYLEREQDELEVVTEVTVADALEHVEGDIDCIVSDYEMSPIDGIEFLARVREQDDELPFILLTGKGSEELASEAISEGVTDYLQKGYGIDHYTILANRIVNVVEQYRSRRALAESQEHLALFFEQSPLGVIEWDENFDLVRLNRRAAEVLGYEEDELAGGSWERLVPENEHEAFELSVSNLLERDGGYHQVTRNVRANGERIVCEWHNRVVTDEDGEVVAIFSQFQDITERVRRKEAITNLHDVAGDLAGAETEDRVFELTVEAAESVLSFDNAGVATAADGSLEVVSASVERVHEEFSEAIEASVVEGVYHSDEVKVLDDVAEVAQLADSSAFGSMMLVPITGHGVLQVCDDARGAFDDTDRELAELLCRHTTNALDRLAYERRMERQTTELADRNEQLDRFVSVVSHDLRNPVQALKTSLDLVENTGAQEDFDRCRRSIDRIERLLEDLLTLAREDGEIDPESVELASLTAEVAENVDTDSADVEIETDAVIEADRTRSQQLVGNLVDNAVKHGGEEVTVRVGSLEDGFYVEDDGPGIPEDERDEVFEHGYSGEPDGTGFGLAIVKQVASDHDWEVTVTESPDGGARFEIRNVERNW